MTNMDLKQFREKISLSQSEFAKILGVSQPAISAAERKPGLLVSNNLHKKFLEKFEAGNKTKNQDDPQIQFEIQIKLKKSELELMDGKKGFVDISKFFITL
jgi:DNA-binding XRE family transcriptional regulator